MSEQRTYPEGYFVGLWMAVFTPLGVAFGLIFGEGGMIGVGIAISVSVGLAVGAGVEARYKQKALIRPLTEEEKRRRSRLIVAGVALLLVGVGVFVVLYATQ